MQTHVDNSFPMEKTQTLADFTSLNLIIPSLSGQEASVAIRELSGVLQRENRIIDSVTFCQWVIKRELLCGTVTEPGWAMPHGLVKDLSQPCFALGRWVPPKIWTNSKEQVNLVFLFAIPERNVQAYDSLIIALGGLSKETQLVNQLLNAENEIVMLNVLKQVNVHVTSAV